MSRTMLRIPIISYMCFYIDCQGQGSWPLSPLQRSLLFLIRRILIAKVNRGRNWTFRPTSMPILDFVDLLGSFWCVTVIFCRSLHLFLFLTPLCTTGVLWCALNNFIFACQKKNNNKIQTPHQNLVHLPLPKDKQLIFNMHTQEGKMSLDHFYVQNKIWQSKSIRVNLPLLDEWFYF